MSTIRPFRGIRPRQDLAASIAALPYDVYSTEEARQITDANPLSFLRIDRAETQFPQGTDPYSPEVYDRARDTLYEMIDDGLFVEDPAAAFYVYSLTMNGRTQTGLVACASIDDYENGVILKHENTLEAKEVDRIRHVSTCSAHTGPIFLAHRPDEDLRKILHDTVQSQPLYDFTAEDKVRHQVWIIDDPARIHAITEIFSRMDRLYIADGHHRAASAVKAGLNRRAADPASSGEEEYNYFLSVLFASDELRIYDYNRAVSDLNGYTFEQFLDMIKGGFEVKPATDHPFRPKRKGIFGIYHGGTWYEARVLPHLFTEDPVKDLDVSILQDHVLGPVLGIRNPKSDSRIRFIGGIRGAEALEQAADSTGGIAFAMYPTSMNELFRVADAGMLMPPKSTWFEPKLRSGLFIHRF